MYNKTPDYYNDYLEHYGVLGMKWGVRRYQNEDGSYTKAGIKRYALNRDINNKSRKNIAKIRTGEAKRRYDTAKKNNPTNYTRIAELRGRVRSAKANERSIKSIDRGTKLAAKGQTISKNNLKVLGGYLGAYVGSKGMEKFLTKRLQDLGAQGRYTPKHNVGASLILAASTIGVYSLAAGYNVKKDIDNRDLRSYYRAHSSGRDTIKSVGSEEYADRVKKASKKK